MTIEATKRRAIGGCCQGCSDRYPGCHDHCKKYQAAKKEWETYKESLKAGEYLTYKFDQIRKTKRSRCKYE